MSSETFGLFGTGRNYDGWGVGLYGVVGLVNEISDEAEGRARSFAVSAQQVNPGENVGTLQDRWNGDILLVRADGSDKHGHPVPVELRWLMRDRDRALETAHVLGGSVAADHVDGSTFRVVADNVPDLGHKLDCILNNDLLGERPLLGARLNCIVPMHYTPLAAASPHYARLRAAALAKAHEPDSSLAVEYSKEGEHYFLPHVNDLVAPKPKDIVGVWKVAADETVAARLDEKVVTLRRELSGHESITVQTDSRMAFPVEARLGDLRLHFYAESTFALEWSCELEALRLEKDEPLWHYMSRQGKAGPASSAAAWLDFSEQARKIYSAFKAEEHEIKKGEKVARLTLTDGTGSILQQVLHDHEDEVDVGTGRLPFVGLLDWLMSRAFQDVIQRPAGEMGWARLFELRCDDRARLVQSIALAGGLPDDKAPRLAPAAARPGSAVAGGPVSSEGPEIRFIKGPPRARQALDPFHARAVMVDNWGIKHAYDPDFAEAETDAGAYDRFRSWGTRFLVNDHCFAFVGFGAYALSPIHSDHMAGEYRRMMLLILLNGAVLGTFSREIAAGLAGWRPGYRDDAAARNHEVLEAYRRLMPRFVKFANINWVERVSSQVQGIELFDLMLARSQAIRDYRFLNDEISRTDSYLELEAEARERELEAESAASKEWLATLGTIGAIFVGAVGAITTDTLPFVPALITDIHGLFGAPAAGFLDEWGGVIASTFTLVVAFGVIGSGLVSLPGSHDTRLAMKGWDVAVAVAIAAVGPLAGLLPGVFPAAPFLFLLLFAVAAFVARPHRRFNVEITDRAGIANLRNMRRVWAVLAIAMALHMAAVSAQTWGAVDVGAWLEKPSPPTALTDSPVAMPE